MQRHAGHPPSSVLYADLREKWKNEDNLINQRVTWLLTSQGFLFSAFGVLAKLRLDSKAAPSIEGEFWLHNLGEALVVVSALVVTYFLRDGIFAAIRAMDEIKRLLKGHQDADRIWSEVRVDVLDDTSKDGTSPARGMVNTFATIWVGLLLYEVFRFASMAVADHGAALMLLCTAGAAWVLLGRARARWRNTTAAAQPMEARP